MQTYRTMVVVPDTSQIVLPDVPFRPGQLVEVLVFGEEKDRPALARDLASLFKETQALPQIQRVSEEDIAAEIAVYRSGR